MGTSCSFIADSMLGTMARRLRMLGIDTLYLRDAQDSELKYLVRSQDRILLTRDVSLARELNDKAWLVTGTGVRQEFFSIASRLALFSSQVSPFSRCLDCNSRLEHVDRSDVQDKVPPYVLKTYGTFFHCPDCEKVFWEGTHGENMSEEIEWMEKQLIKGRNTED
jgi:uncharacterized protein with PIN domain